MSVFFLVFGSVVLLLLYDDWVGQILGLRPSWLLCGQILNLLLLLLEIILLVYIVEVIFLAIVLLVLLLVLTIRIELVKLEGLPVLHSYILARRQTIQIKDQMKHLFICLFVVKWNYRYTVVNLIGKWIDRVINDYHVFHASISNYTQIFHIIALRRLNTVLAIETILEKFMIRVDIV